MADPTAWTYVEMPEPARRRAAMPTLRPASRRRPTGRTSLNPLNLFALIRADCRPYCCIGRGLRYAHPTPGASGTGPDGPAGTGLKFMLHDGVDHEDRRDAGCRPRALAGVLGAGACRRAAAGLQLVQQGRRFRPRYARRQALQRGPLPAERQAGLQGSREEIRRSRPRRIRIRIGRASRC